MRRDFILDRDMRPPAGSILRYEHSSECLHQILPDALKVRAVDRIRHATSERDHAFGACDWRRRNARISQAPQQFGFGGRRQMVKHRQVRREAVTFGREVRPSLRIEPLKIRLAEQG